MIALKRSILIEALKSVINLFAIAGLVSSSLLDASVNFLYAVRQYFHPYPKGLSIAE
jgi:hypothetical protein